MLLKKLKNNDFKRLLLLSLFLLLLLPYALRAQKGNYSAGLGIGLSTFESLSTSVSGVQLSAFYEFPVWFSRSFNLKASLFYIRKTEFFLPEDSGGKYYPYFYGVSLSGIMRQYLKSIFFVEEEAGILLMKNKFFETIDETNYGIIFGMGGGIDLTSEGKGFLLSLGYKGSVTFNKSTPSFNSFQIQAQYLF